MSDVDLIARAAALPSSEYHNHRYYVLDDPQVPDSRIRPPVCRAATASSNNPSLLTADSPTQRVGGAAAAGIPAVFSHRTPMLSLNNAFSDEDIGRLTAVCAGGGGRCG